MRSRHRSGMRRSFTALCAMAVMFTVWWWAGRETAPAPRANPPRVVQSASAPSRRSAAQPAGAVRAPLPGVETEPVAATSPDYRIRLRDARDYWELADSLYVDARQGDAAA